MPGTATHTRTKNHHPMAQGATRKRSTASRARPRSTATHAKRALEPAEQQVKTEAWSFLARSKTYGMDAMKSVWSELRSFGQVRPMIALGIGALLGSFIASKTWR